MNKKNIISIGVLTILILYGISRLLFNVAYSEPSKYKKALKSYFKVKYPTLPHSNLESLVSCIYVKFEKRYGYPGFFPDKDYSFQDKSDIFDCSIQFLPLDSSYKLKMIGAKDSIIRTMK